MRNSSNEKKMLIKSVSIRLLDITLNENLIMLSLKKMIESDIYFCAKYFCSAVVHCMLQTLQEADSLEVKVIGISFQSSVVLLKDALADIKQDISKT